MLHCQKHRSNYFEPYEAEFAFMFSHRRRCGRWHFELEIESALFFELFSYLQTNDWKHSFWNKGLKENPKKIVGNILSSPFLPPPSQKEKGKTMYNTVLDFRTMRKSRKKTSYTTAYMEKNNCAKRNEYVKGKCMVEWGGGKRDTKTTMRKAMRKRYD